MLELFINYGLAGVILFIFYKLMTNELQELRKAILMLYDEVKALNVKLQLILNGDK